MRRLFLNSGFAFLIVLSAFFSFVNPFPVQAANERYFVMGQVFLVDGIHINCDLDGRWATAGNKTLNLTDDGTHGTFSVYMANGTTGTVTSGTSTISGSPVTLSAGLNSITATGSGTATLNITIGTAANWNTVNSWSAASGGACTASVPTSTNSVYFNVNSFTAASQILTVDASAFCLDMNWTGATNTPTLKLTNYIGIYGNLILISAMNTDGISCFSMVGGSKTITMGGKTLNYISATNYPYFQIWGSATLTDITSVWAVFVYAGTFNTGNQTFNGSVYAVGADYSKTITLGSSIITGDVWDMESSSKPVTLTAHTSTINMSGANCTFKGGSKTYNIVNFNSLQGTISGSNTFVNLIRNGTSAINNVLVLTSGTTQTVTGVCKLTGNSTKNRLLVRSSVLASPAILDVDGVWTDTAYTDFMDITSTHAIDLSAITGLSGDCLGNSGITFTTSSAQTWNGTTGSWSDSIKWTNRIPLPQDDVSAGGTGNTITVDMPRIGKDIVFTGTPVVVLSVISGFALDNGVSNYGSWTYVSGMTYTHSYLYVNYLCGRSTCYFTSSGKAAYVAYVYAPSGTYVLQDDAYNIYAMAGTLDWNGKNMTSWQYYTSGSYIRSILMRTGSLIITNNTAYTVFSFSGTNLTVDGDESSIIITNNSVNSETFAGGGYIYGNLTYQGSAASVLTISGNNTFNTFTVDRSVANKTLTLTDNSTQTVGNFICATSGTRVLTINSSGSFGAILTKTGGSTINMDYLNLTNNTGSPSNTWYYGPNSTINAGVTGWQSFTGFGESVGGTITTDGLYTIHTFTTVGTSSFVASRAGTVEVLVVAGGGGGGSFGGGGGAGGVVYNSSFVVTAGSKVVTVGDGGAGDVNTSGTGSSGNNSVFDSLTAIGGGGGASRSSCSPCNGTSGGSGGSGGGASPSDNASVKGVGGDADYLSPRQGYDGGSEFSIGWGGSGGGGAGAVGVGGSGNTGGAGGDGVSTYSSLLIVANVGEDLGGAHWIAGGGGGVTWSGGAGTVGIGGKGGGGAGGKGVNGVAGTSNTGGGGGGSDYPAAIGAKGGSGVVIIRYLTSGFSSSIPIGSAGGAGAGGGVRGTYTATQGSDGSNAYNYTVLPSSPTKSPLGGAKTKDLAGGGGGAGGAGTAATMLMAGVGGEGYSCNITGSSVKYGPGGGGGARNTKFSPGAGGADGGGAGGEDGSDGTNGTANTGGGGGGGGYHNESQPPYDEKIHEGKGGAGGSGIVIVKYGSTVVSFTSSTTWTVPGGVTSVKVLVVGGGGGGGESIGGGGGGGGVIYNESYSVTAGNSIIVTVGAGGAGGDGTPGYPPGAKGGNSVFGTLIALGGGGGAGYDVNSQ
jgi:hypothetical protein